MNTYCHLCGSKNMEGKSQPWECSGCGNIRFESPAPTVELVLFSGKDQVLLSKRAIEPDKGKYDLFGGFVMYGELAEDALRREIMEELGLSEDAYTAPQFVCTWSGAGYTFSKETRKLLNIVFTAKLHDPDTTIVAQDDVAEVLYCPMDKLDTVDYSCYQFEEIIHQAHKILFG